MNHSSQQKKESFRTQRTNQSRILATQTRTNNLALIALLGSVGLGVRECVRPTYIDTNAKFHYAIANASLVEYRVREGDRFVHCRVFEQVAPRMSREYESLIRELNAGTLKTRPSLNKLYVGESLLLPDLNGDGRVGCRRENTNTDFNHSQIE